MKNSTLGEQEIQELRSATKGTARKIHFNNAGSSLPPDIVVDTVVDYLQEEAVTGGYETEAAHRQQLEFTYDLIARLINSDRDEVALVESASVAWGLAFNGIEFKAGDVILTSELEYITNLLGFLNLQKSNAIEVKIIPNDQNGNFSLRDLENAISPNVKLIAITHISSTGGGVLPIAGIGEIARKHKILYLLDACQTAGQMPLDVKEIKCDMLAATGRKFLRAPRGTGFLYVRKEIQDDLKIVLLDGFTAPVFSRDDFKVRSDARRFELYEKSRALTLGLGAAIEYALHIGLDRIWDRVRHLADFMRQRLERIEGVTVHDIGEKKCGIITFSVNGFESADIKNRLAEKNVNVSVALARSALIYMDKHHLSSIVRASVHYYNTESEITIMCDELDEIIERG